MTESNFDSVVSEIIFDTPAGEIQEVYNSLITLVGDNAKDTILDVIEQYNVKNNIPIDVDGKLVILSENNKSGASRYVDAVNGVSFTVDHLNKKGLDIEPMDNASSQEECKMLHDQLTAYTAKAYPGDVTVGVYPIADSQEFEIIAISTKYNPANFWNGDWRSKYIYDSAANEISGSIDVQVHYYEDGNVSFKSNKTVEKTAATDVVEAISQIEQDFEKSLDTSFTDLNEKQFKALRRRLPITRSKVNWGKAIGNYRLGKDAAEGL